MRGNKKKYFFLFVFFLWWEQVELSGQKVSGREICCFFKGKNIFFSPRESLWLEQVDLGEKRNLTLGYQICSDLINLELEFPSSDLSLYIRETKKKYFFSPPVAPSGVASTCSNTTGQRGGEEKKYFFL